MSQTTAHRALGAEVRAVEAGRYAIVNGDGSFTVRSEDGTTHYRVIYFGDGTGAVRFTCTCAFGERNPEATCGCKHMAAVGRSLVRRGIAVQDGDGLFRVPGWTAPADRFDDVDPFDGFPVGYDTARAAHVASGLAAIANLADHRPARGPATFCCIDRIGEDRHEIQFDLADGTTAAVELAPAEMAALRDELVGLLGASSTVTALWRVAWTAGDYLDDPNEENAGTLVANLAELGRVTL